MELTQARNDLIDARQLGPKSIQSASAQILLIVSFSKANAPSMGVRTLDGGASYRPQRMWATSHPRRERKLASAIFDGSSGPQISMRAFEPAASEPQGMSRSIRSIIEKE
ncbi:hypothetical protein AOQ73_21085 [Bradyrhizobium pachyrhizi]|nr:hypothetical protein AOQ73_21085 [Bradyrhizobium pachyrhizi]